MSLDRIEGKVDKLDAHLLEVKITLARNTESLEHHMIRTQMNEQRVEKLEYVLIGIAALGVLGGIVRLLFVSV